MTAADESSACAPIIAAQGLKHVAARAVVTRVGVELPRRCVLADPQPQALDLLVPKHRGLAFRKVNEGVDSGFLKVHKAARIARLLFRDHVLSFGFIRRLSVKTCRRSPLVHGHFR
ncbi:MAG: hypothetical protein ABSB37_16965 [Xanthobacteraceae bacterium]